MRSVLWIAAASAAAAAPNAFTGASGSTWFGDASNWSGGQPSYPDKVLVVDKTVKLLHAAQQAADKVTLEGTAKLSLGAKLVLGPTALACPAGKYNELHDHVERCEACPAGKHQPSVGANFCPFIAINGGFSLWGSWTVCTKTCGTGQQSRVRACTNPAPKHGGAPCSGPVDETRACTPRPCPIHKAAGTPASLRFVAKDPDATGERHHCDVHNGGGKRLVSTCSDLSAAGMPLTARLRAARASTTAAEQAHATARRTLSKAQAALKAHQFDISLLKLSTPVDGTFPDIVYPTPAPTASPTATPTAAPTLAPTMAPTPAPTPGCVTDKNYYDAASNSCLPCADDCAVGHYRFGCGHGSQGSCQPCSLSKANAHHVSNGDHGQQHSCKYECNVGYHSIGALCALITSAPTASPTSAPTASPTSAPTASPTSTPTASPTSAPTASPTSAPTPSCVDNVSFYVAALNSCEACAANCAVGQYRFACGHSSAGACVPCNTPKENAHHISSGEHGAPGTCAEACDAGFHGVGSACVRITAAPTPAPVHGNWGGYGGFSGCSAHCGGGTRTRHRSCNSPAPAHGGAACAGSSSQTVACNTHACPVNGNWGGWGGFGGCSVDCGGGTRTRHRSCNNPAPAHGGHGCPGSSSQSVACNTHGCCAGNHGHACTCPMETFHGCQGCIGGSENSPNCCVEPRRFFTCSGQSGQCHVRGNRNCAGRCVTLYATC